MRVGANQWLLKRPYLLLRWSLAVVALSCRVLREERVAVRLGGFQKYPAAYHG